MYFHERVTRELQTLFSKFKANDFSEVFAWQLFQIKSSHMS